MIVFISVQHSRTQIRGTKPQTSRARKAQASGQPTSSSLDGALGQQRERGSSFPPRTSPRSAAGPSRCFLSKWGLALCMKPLRTECVWAEKSGYNPNNHASPHVAPVLRDPRKRRQIKRETHKKKRKINKMDNTPRTPLGMENSSRVPWRYFTE